MSFRLYQVRSDIEFIKTFEFGKVKYMIKDPISGTFFSLKFLQFEILKFFRGKPRTNSDCARYMIERFDVDIEPEQISAFISGMRAKNILTLDHHYPLSPLSIISIRLTFKEYLIQKLKRAWPKSAPTPVEKGIFSEVLSLVQQNRVFDALAALGNAKARPGVRLAADAHRRLSELIVENIQREKSRDPAFTEKQPFDRVLTEEVKSFDPMPILDRLRPLIFAVLSPWFMSAFAVFCGVTAYLLVKSEKACFTCWTDNTIYFFNIYVYGILIGHVMGVIHEFGHAMMCYRFGGKVNKIGILMFYGYIPTFYADVTDAYRMKKWQRILVSMAGAGSEAMLGMVAGFFLVFTDYDSFAYRLLWITWVFGLSSLIPNYLPAFKNDGYYMATDILSVDNLFSKSFGYCWAELRSFFSGEPVDTSEYPVHERKRLWIYFIYIFFQTCFFFLLMQHLAMGTISRDMALIPKILLFLMALRLCFALVTKIVTTDYLESVRSFLRYKRAWALVFVVAFFLVPVANDLELNAEVVAERSYPIHSPVDGFIESVHFSSDQPVREKSALFSLRSPQVTETYEKAIWGLWHARSGYAEAVEGMDEGERIALRAVIEAREERIRHLKRAYARAEGAAGEALASRERLGEMLRGIRDEESYLAGARAALARKRGQNEDAASVLREDVAFADAALADSGKRLSDLFVVAPAEGFIHQDGLANLIGKRVTAGEVVAELRSLRRKIVAEIPESRLNEVGVGSRARFVTRNGRSIALTLEGLSPVTFEHDVGTQRYNIFKEPRKVHADFGWKQADDDRIAIGESGALRIDCPKQTLFMKLFGRRLRNMGLSLWKNA